MQRSTNLNLYLPGNSDYRDVSALSWNFETIDDAIGETNGKLFIAVASATDLNDLTTPGFYGVASGTVAGSLSNSPITGTSFVMIVMKKSSSYITQIATSGDKFYIRSQYSGGFQSWTELTTNTTENFSTNVSAGQSGTSVTEANLRRHGKVVIFNGVLSNSGSSAKTIAGYDDLFKFPTSLRPPANSFMFGRISDGTIKDVYVAYYDVDGYGSIRCATSITLPGNGNIRIYGTWVCN